MNPYRFHDRESVEELKYELEDDDLKSGELNGLDLSGANAQNANFSNATEEGLKKWIINMLLGSEINIKEKR